MEVPATMDVFKMQFQLVADIFRRMSEDEQLKAIKFAKEFMKELLQEMQLVLDQIQQKVHFESKVGKLSDATVESETLQESQLQRQWVMTPITEKAAPETEDAERSALNNNCSPQISRNHENNFVYDEFQLEPCAAADYNYLLPACDKIQLVEGAIEKCMGTVEKCRRSVSQSLCDSSVVNKLSILVPDRGTASLPENAGNFQLTQNKTLPCDGHPEKFSNTDSANISDGSKQDATLGNIANSEPQTEADRECSRSNLMQEATCLKMKSLSCIAIPTASSSSISSPKAPIKEETDSCKLRSRLPAASDLRGRPSRRLCKKKKIAQESCVRNADNETEPVKKKKKGNDFGCQENEAVKKVLHDFKSEKSSVLTRSSTRALIKAKKEICCEIISNKDDGNILKQAQPLKNHDRKDLPTKSDRLQYYCSECGQSFSHGKSYKSHIIRHGITELSCRRCRKQFVNMIEFRNHTCKTSLKLYCDQCNVNFNHPQHFQKHMSGHNRNNCKICNAQFAKRKALCRHLRTSHKIVEAEKFYHCPHCDRKFIKRPSLYVHLKDHADGKIVCMKCGFMCETKEHFTKHTLKHTQEAKFHCEKCNENFLRRQQYEQHMTGHDKYDCTLCDISFSTKKHLLKHKRLVHRIQTREEKKHICTVCDKRFQRPMLLRIHTRIHTGERPIQCTHCDKNFRTPKALAKHMKTTAHLKASGQNDTEPVELDKPFLCAQCGAKFFRRQGLVRHMQQLHSDNCPYSCPYCDYSCKCKTNLKRHVELHTTERRYICEVCGASFHARATLKEHHAYVHSESRNFVCSECGKSFKGLSGLRRHHRIHSDVRPYVCYCGQAYKRMSHLKRHMIALHGALFKSKRVSRIVGDDNSQSSNSLPALSKTDANSYQDSETMTLQVSDGFLVLPGKGVNSDNNSLTITVQHDVVELLQNISVEHIGSNSEPDVELSQPQTNDKQDFLSAPTRSDLIISASREVIQQTLNIECPTSAQLPLITGAHKLNLQQLVPENALPCELNTSTDSTVSLSQTDGNSLSSLPNALFDSDTGCSLRTQPVQIFPSDESPVNEVSSEQVQNLYPKLPNTQAVVNKSFCISPPCSSSSQPHNFPVSSCASASAYSITRLANSNNTPFSDPDSACQQSFSVSKSEYNANLSSHEVSSQPEFSTSAVPSSASCVESMFCPTSQKVYCTVVPSNSAMPSNSV